MFISSFSSIAVYLIDLHIQSYIDNAELPPPGLRNQLLGMPGGSGTAQRNLARAGSMAVPEHPMRPTGSAGAQTACAVQAFTHKSLLGIKI